MKKLLLVLAMLSGTLICHAQFKAGVNLGIPVGDADDFYNFSAGVDLYYMLGDAESMFNFGPTAGFINYFAEDIEIGGITIEGEDFQFIPVGGAARVTLADLIKVGADVGYGIAVTEDAEGGFYYRLSAGLDLAEQLEVNVIYHTLTEDEFDLSSVGLQVLYQFTPAN